MPEGPELYFASRFINSTCKDRVFSGKVQKSEVSKNPPVSWDAKKYSISAVARGKELKLTLTEFWDPPKNEAKAKTKASKSNKTTGQCPRIQHIVVRFGMSGRFRFDPLGEVHKHAHLNFFTADDKMVLSFVDTRRFGTWDPEGLWNPERGPCILFEYEKFRENVVKNLSSATFNKPICEALLDQKYFNGIGNYLRAEILYRAHVPPFVKARDVLERVCTDAAVGVKPEEPDLLQLCHTIPQEVINLTQFSGYDGNTDSDDNSAFLGWLQCYYNPQMKNVVDHNKRTIWFHGPAGPMAPKDSKERHSKSKKKVTSKAAFESNVKSEEAVRSLDGGDTVEGGVTVKREKGQSSRNKSASNKESNAKMSRKTERKTKLVASDEKPLPSTRGPKRTSAHGWPSSPRKLRSSLQRPATCIKQNS